MGPRRTLEALEAQATRNGYQRGAHKEKDKIQGLAKHVANSIAGHDRTLQRYVL